MDRMLQALDELDDAVTMLRHLWLLYGAGAGALLAAGGRKNARSRSARSPTGPMPLTTPAMLAD